MIGLDTNVLARLIIRDDLEQVTRIEKALAAIEARKENIYVNMVVLSELIWVLDSRYGYERHAIARAIAGLLDTDYFVLENESIIAESLPIYESSKCEFADVIIGVTNHRAGCKTTLTFDKYAAKLDEFTLLA